MKNLFASAPYWDCKTTNAVHADSPGVYTSEILINLSTKNKSRLKCDVTDSSGVNSLRQPLLYSFVFDKPTRFKVFLSLKQYTKKSEQPCFENYNILFGKK